MKTYKTSEVAEIFRMHPNTVMLYEKWGYIAPPERRENGYRIYTQEHLDQIRIAKILLKSDLIKCYMRFEARNIIRTAARGELENALELSGQYLTRIQEEIENELIVVKQIKEIMEEETEGEKDISLSRSGAAKMLGLSMITIINWERNGMLEVPRNESNNYRIYTEHEIRLLKVIRVLRKENYAAQCIRGIIRNLTEKESMDKKAVWNSGHRLLSSLEDVEESIMELMLYLKELIDKKAAE